MSAVHYMTRVVITGMGMVYPGYQSYKAVKKADVSLQQEWLKYWLVLSVLSGLMLMIEPILANYVPMLPVFKITAITLLVLPKTKGFLKIYEVALQPQLDRHEAAIDATADRLYKAGQQHASNVRPAIDSLVVQGREFATKTLNKKQS